MTLIALVALIVLDSIASSMAYTDPACANYDHPNYGCVGQCASTTSCPGGHYISQLCPTQPAGVKCCFTTGSDSACANYDHFVYGQVGQCIHTDDCPNRLYISGLCPTLSSAIKCCFKKPINTCSVCGANAQSLACAIQSHDKIKLLDNNKYLNPAGDNDGADALSNIRDTCNGMQAKLSSYSCSSGSAPGGRQCLRVNILQYLLDLADAGYTIQVNAITGACHSSGSYHYQGTAVDLQVYSDSDHQEWMRMCSDAGAVESFGPGDAGHSGHTHCAFPV